MNTDLLTNLKQLEQRFVAHVQQLHATEAVTYLDNEGFCIRQDASGVKVRLDQVACAPLTGFAMIQADRAGL